jgi:hypothetical protein
MVRILMNHELGTIWKKTVIAQFEILFRHSPGMFEKNDENLSQTGRLSGRNLDRESLEYGLEILTTLPKGLVTLVLSAFTTASLVPYRFL